MCRYKCYSTIQSSIQNVDYKPVTLNYRNWTLQSLSWIVNNKSAIKLPTQCRTQMFLQFSQETITRMLKWWYSFAFLELIVIKYSDISEVDTASISRVSESAKWMLKYTLYGFFICYTRDLFPGNVNCRYLFINEVVYSKQRTYSVSETATSSETHSRIADSLLNKRKNKPKLLTS
jgi:hypothetical protein